jgi:hypothetical protein
MSHPALWVADLRCHPRSCQAAAGHHMGRGAQVILQHEKPACAAGAAEMWTPVACAPFSGLAGACWGWVRHSTLLNLPLLTLISRGSCYL